MPGRLLALASGRVPALARTAVLGGLLLLLLAWVVLDPGHQPQPRLAPAPPTVVALRADSPWVDRAELADPASLYLESPRGSDTLPILAQPEATPFLAFGPDLRSQPDQPLGLASPRSKPDALQAPGFLLLPEDQPLLTLGQKPQRALPLTRPPLCEVLSDGGELLRQIPILESDTRKVILKLFSDNILTINGPVEFRLGIDNYGLQSPPFLTRSSGLPNLDQATLQWASAQPWFRTLPPGSYLLRFGP